MPTLQGSYLNEMLAACVCLLRLDGLRRSELPLRRGGCVSGLPVANGYLMGSGGLRRDGLHVLRIRRIGGWLCGRWFSDVGATGFSWAMDVVGAP